MDEGESGAMHDEQQVFGVNAGSGEAERRGLFEASAHEAQRPFLHHLDQPGADRASRLRKGFRKEETRKPRGSPYEAHPSTKEPAEIVDGILGRRRNVRKQSLFETRDGRQHDFLLGAEVAEYCALRDPYFSRDGKRGEPAHAVASDDLERGVRDLFSSPFSGLSLCHGSDRFTSECSLANYTPGWLAVNPAS